MKIVPKFIRISLIFIIINLVVGLFICFWMKGDYKTFRDILVYISLAYAAIAVFIFSGGINNEAGLSYIERVDANLNSLAERKKDTLDGKLIIMILIIATTTAAIAGLIGIIT